MGEGRKEREGVGAPYVLLSYSAVIGGLVIHSVLPWEGDLWALAGGVTPFSRTVPLAVYLWSSCENCSLEGGGGIWGSRHWSPW